MAKTKRRRPSQRSKRRPPSHQAPLRITPAYETAPTRTFVAPSQKAKRQRVVRAAAAVGAAVGLLVVVIMMVGGGGGGGELRTATLSGEVLAPTVNARSTGTAEPIEFVTGDRLSEGAVVQTDATGLGEFTYADGSVVRVGPSSEYTLTKSRSEGKRRDIEGTLKAGRTWHRVTPRDGDDADYKVAVLGATALVKGTSFATVCPVENDCFYTVIKGKIHVEDAVNQDADLAAGDQVEIKFGRIEPVKHLTPEEIGADPWLVENITLDGDVPPAPGETTTTLLGETTTSLEDGTATSITGGTVTTKRGTATATTRSSGTPGTQPATATTQAPTPATDPPATTVAPATTSSTVWREPNPPCKNNDQRPVCKRKPTTTTPPTTVP